MKSNSQIVGAVLVGLGTWVLGRYVVNTMHQQKTLANKKLIKQAVQNWEGEGGNVIDAAHRSAAGQIGRA